MGKWIFGGLPVGLAFPVASWLRVATEWSAEIHNNNVSLATAAALRSKYCAALSHDTKTPRTGDETSILMASLPAFAS